MVLVVEVCCYIYALSHGCLQAILKEHFSVHKSHVRKITV